MRQNPLLYLNKGDGMELIIQMGHNMRKLALEHLEDFGNGTVIISPMNILPKSVKSFSDDVHKRKGNILIDPQLYYPRKFQKNLAKYSYWPQENYTVLESGQFDKVVQELAALNKDILAEAFLLPSLITNKVDELWDKVQRSVIENAKQYASGMRRIHTIALSSDVVNDEIQVEKIISFVEKWDVDGIYIVCEHPERYYLVDKPLWVSNLMSLVAGIKRQHKRTIVGYASHQLLCMALAKCDAIASGNFLNLRWFQPEHFETMEDNQISRRAVWYYCPQALSEFKVPFLDIAKRMGLLDRMAPPEIMKNQYSEMLFGSGLPSSTGFGEKEAFRHYLFCLRKQCQSSARNSYKETMDAHLMMLKTAEQLLMGLGAKGIKGQDRDFTEILDVNRAAISAFDMAYQFSLSQEWLNL